MPQQRKSKSPTLQALHDARLGARAQMRSLFFSRPDLPVTFTLRITDDQTDPWAKRRNECEMSHPPTAKQFPEPLNELCTEHVLYCTACSEPNCPHEIKRILYCTVFLLYEEQSKQDRPTLKALFCFFTIRPSRFRCSTQPWRRAGTCPASSHPHSLQSHLWSRLVQSGCRSGCARAPCR